MRFNFLLKTAVMLAALAMTSTAHAQTPWGNNNNWSPWSGGNNWTPWGGSNRRWGGNNWTPWGGSNRGWGGNSMPWSGGNNWTPWGGNNRRWGGSNRRWGGNSMPWSGGNNWTPWGGSNRGWGGNSMPWSGGNNWTPWGGNSRRWGGRRNTTPWRSTPFGDMAGPWDQGPWNSDWRGGPWKKNNRFWGDSGFDDWMDPADPKGSMERIWDDMLEAPNEMGEMPGGWTAPTISVPNPVGVGDEFEGSARKAPKETATQLDNFRFN